MPKTAYVKMIDIWMLFSLLVPFFEVMLMIMMESMRIKLRNIEEGIRTRDKNIAASKISPSSTNKRYTTENYIVKT